MTLLYIALVPSSENNHSQIDLKRRLSKNIIIIANPHIPKNKNKNRISELVNVYQTPVFLFSDPIYECVMGCAAG